MSRISRVETFACDLPFRASFVIGRGQVGTAGACGQHVFVRLETEDGHAGWGETRALPAWSYETQESIATTIERYFAPLLLGRSPFDLNAIHLAMSERITPAVSSGMPFARSAVDIALHDLQGRILGVPLSDLLGGSVRHEVRLTYALSIAPAAEMAEQALSYPECDSFKIKVAGEPEEDARRVRAVAEARPDARLWLDANQAYRTALLPFFMAGLRDIPRLYCLEQPVKSVDWLGLRQSRRFSSLPVAIDEGCFSSHDVARVAELNLADLLVLKVCKSGGLRECLRSAAVAEAHGIGLLGSGLTECGVGFIASVHLFSTLDLLLPPELNGVQFLEEMLVEGLELRGAAAAVPSAPGLGIRVKEEEIRRRAKRI